MHGLELCRFARWDHPREYGENFDRRSFLSLVVGSSPRIRGESGPFIANPHSGGIIPANTGRIRRHTATWESTWDHPREYGENGRVDRGIRIETGSSPRIRGESASAASTCCATGIIPANTGRIHGSDCAQQGCWDHPREYGENTRFLAALASGYGSSPRIRGEYAAMASYGDYSRIIPANTGRIEPCS